MTPLQQSTHIPRIKVEGAGVTDELFGEERHRVLKEVALAICSRCRGGKPVMMSGKDERRFFHNPNKNASDMSGGLTLCDAYKIWNLPNTGLVPLTVTVRVSAPRGEKEPTP